MRVPKPLRAFGALQARVLVSILIAFVSACTSEATFSVAETRTESFRQREVSDADVLFVIDDSESMVEEQTALALSFEAFIDGFVEQAVDYQVGVVSTDATTRGAFRRTEDGEAVLDSSLDGVADLFGQLVQLPAGGAREEKGLESALWGLGLLEGSAAEAFLRDEAALFVIAVSDEDDQSLGAWRSYARQLEYLKGPGNDGLVSFSAIAGPSGGCTSQTRGAASEGARYRAVTEFTGGSFFSICEDFGAALAELSFETVGLLARFPLSASPRAGVVKECGESTQQGLCVTIDGESRNEDWVYEAATRSIVFDAAKLPEAGAEIVVSYLPAEGSL